MPAALRVTPWPDPVLDVLGHDPRSWYAETFWLPTLGPTALLLMRHLADRFERTPEGVELPVADTAAALGLGARDGASSPLIQSLGRLHQFELALHRERDDDRGAPQRSRPCTAATCAACPSHSSRSTTNGWPANAPHPWSSPAAAPGASRSCSSRRANPSTPSNARSTARASTPRSRTKPSAGPATAKRELDDDAALASLATAPP